jgi:hypothetical protein
MYDIIGDIHGMAHKLDALLAQLGWHKKTSGWVCDAGDRQLLFLGDFIDRGPRNAAVISTVRSLIDAGKARAVMGNHEFNALLYHSLDPDTGKPLRARSEKNQRQHSAFLKEYPLGASNTREVLSWMHKLPVVFEDDHLRAVHACWHPASLAVTGTELQDARLPDDLSQVSASRNPGLAKALDIVTKGLEEKLPDGATFFDKDGAERGEVRVCWWRPDPKVWRDIAVSVDDDTPLPAGSVPMHLQDIAYRDRKPVFFGHYWLPGSPEIQAPSALCLDFSAGKDGPLVAYRFEIDDDKLTPERLVVGNVRA